MWKKIKDILGTQAKPNLDGLSLEEQKLALEIAEFQLPWWQKPKYLGVVLPTLLGAVTISVALFTNIIDDKVLNAENQIDKLKDEKRLHDIEHE